MGKKKTSVKEDEKVARRFYNSAIGSWAGYIYQGLCAVHVSLHTILKSIDTDKEDREFLNYKLYLDAFDDFSIHDDANKALSIHQCKLYKEKKDFSEAIDQMVEQNKYLTEDGISSAETKLYFHCNHEFDIDASKNVTRYAGASGEETWDALEILTAIKDIVITLTEKLNLPKSSKTTVCLLFNLVNDTVLKNHKRFCEQNIQLRELVRKEESAITFNDIWQILYSEMTEYCDEWEKSHIMKYYFIQNLMYILENYEDDDDWEDIQRDSVETAASLIREMDPKDFYPTIKRLHPEHSFGNNKKYNDIVNSTNDRSAQDLIDLVGASSHKVSDKIDWLIETVLISPALFRSNDIRGMVKGLFKNQANLNCLWEYRWLVGRHVSVSVDDIKNFDENITKKYDKPEKSSISIFSKKKIGLLSFDDFRTEKL